MKFRCDENVGNEMMDEPINRCNKSVLRGGYGSEGIKKKSKKKKFCFAKLLKFQGNLRSKNKNVFIIENDESDRGNVKCAEVKQSKLNDSFCALRRKSATKSFATVTTLNVDDVIE